MVQQKKEEHQILKSVDVDGKVSEMSVKIVFDTEKGTTTITPKITTKQLSMNEDIAKAVKQQASNMLGEAYDFALGRTKLWAENNRPDFDPTQGNLFDNLSGKNQPESEEEDEPAPSEGGVDLGA